MHFTWCNAAFFLKFGSSTNKVYFCSMKYLYLTLGTLTLAAGVIGIFVPLLPTTPFLLLTAALYFRGSTRMYNWLLAHPLLGKYIKNFREHKCMPLHAKVISLLTLWGTILYSLLCLQLPLLVRIFLLAVAIGVTWYICSLKTS